MERLERLPALMLCALLGFAPHLSRGQDKAVIPYAHLLKMGRGNSAAKAESYRLKITSSIEGVKPQDIQLTLNSSQGPRPLPVEPVPVVDEKGQVVRHEGHFTFPYSESLESENPQITTNQPKGTLNIQFTITVPPFTPPKIENGKIRYQSLFEPLVALLKEIQKVDPNFGLAGYGQLVLKIKTKEPIKLTRTMGTGDKSYTGVRTYQPDKEEPELSEEERNKGVGVVMMAMEPFTFEANPEVSIPDPKITLEILPVDPLQLVAIKTKY